MAKTWTKTCVTCGDEFETKFPVQKVCCQECKDLRANEQRFKYYVKKREKIRQRYKERYRTKKGDEHLGLGSSKPLNTPKYYNCQRCGHKTVNRFLCETCHIV